MIGTNWKARALAAEAVIEQLRERIVGIEALQADRAALVSIVRNGRMLRFSFVRNGKITVIETYGALSDNVEGWKEELLA